MFCPKCGVQLNEGQAFCSSCGSAVSSQPDTRQPKPAPNQYYQTPSSAPSLGTSPYHYGSQNSDLYRPDFRHIHMKWFHFLIYFLLFAGAVIDVLYGVTVLTGAQYTSEDGKNIADKVYFVFKNLKGYDIVYGIELIALGAFRIFTRFSLASYKENAPKYLTATYIASAAITAFYNFAVMGMLPKEAYSLSEVLIKVGIIVAISAVMVILNKIYFGKRKYLFVN